MLEDFNDHTQPERKDWQFIAINAINNIYKTGVPWLRRGRLTFSGRVQVGHQAW